MLNGVEVKHGLGAARASPGKSVAQLLPLVKEIVAEIRAHCGLGQQVLLRLHSDIDQSLIIRWVKSRHGFSHSLGLGLLQRDTAMMGMPLWSRGMRK